MSLGYNRPLYLLPFDHRRSYSTGMFHFTPPLTADEHDIVAGSKQVIYEGFQQALSYGVPTPRAGILVDEEFGAGILRDAITFAKVLVRYNPENDPALNQRQSARLRQLSDYCRAADQRFMFELLVPATKAQLDRAQGNNDTYDRRMRPELMLLAIRTLQDAGVEPDVWKIEGLDRREDCERAVATARRDGRNDVGCIVLGRGADETKVVGWLETAASVPGFIGFAVGRTTFWDAVADYEAKKATRAEAVSRVARRYAEWAAIFERAHLSTSRRHNDPDGRASHRG